VQGLKYGSGSIDTDHHSKGSMDYRGLTYECWLMSSPTYKDVAVNDTALNWSGLASKNEGIPHCDCDSTRRI